MLEQNVNTQTISIRNQSDPLYSQEYGAGDVIHVENSLDTGVAGGFISIPSSGAATPYPSSITYVLPCVIGVDCYIAKLNVNLDDFHHTWPTDVDILLVSPSGTKCLLMSDAGVDQPYSTTVDLTFDSFASNTIPQNSQIVSGTYLPTNYNVYPDNFPPPAPSGGYNTDLSVFNGENFGGTWELYVVDNMGGYGGYIGDWGLDIWSTSDLLNVQNRFTSGGYAVSEYLRQINHHDIVRILDLGDRISLEGNAWRHIPLVYNVTPDTVLQLDVKIDGLQDLGEVQGIGFDTDNIFDNRIASTALSRRN